MDEIKLELAFKNQQFSGIVVGEHLIEDGEVVDYIKELEERQKWIDEVARPTHPDDERPWCAAYLDCREKIKELEENNEGLRDALNLRKGALVQATNGIKQLNEYIRELELRITVLELPAQNYNKTLVRAEQAEARIKELEKESLKNKEEGLKNFDALYEHYQKSEVKVKKLEEGIKKHKDKKYGLVEMRTGKIIAYADFSDEDKELYKLIEKK